mmetsp:Transcript_15553/g.47458  ORF Transcript_15553/g.47458 Transcript_15553/m.47458 type:complete len:203 (+) Transcript_15553:1424-2032(+)
MRQDLLAQVDHLRAQLADAQTRRGPGEGTGQARSASRSGPSSSPANGGGGGDAAVVEALRSALAAKQAEVERKAAMLAQLGAQLRTETERADAAEDQVEHLATAADANPARARDLEAARAELHDVRGQVAALERDRAEMDARRMEAERELASVRAAHEAAQAELDALSPEFFEEVEELKYNYAQSSESLARYERLYGRLPPA